MLRFQPLEAAMSRICIHIVAAPTWMENLGFVFMLGLVVFEQYRVGRLRATVEQLRK
jgi:hypothetical protein